MAVGADPVSHSRVNALQGIWHSTALHVGSPAAQNKAARLLIANGRSSPSGFVGARGLKASAFRSQA